MTNLATLKALLAAATQGEWKARTNRTTGVVSIQVNLPCINGLSAWFTLFAIHPEDEATEGMSEGVLNDQTAPANAAFIIAAHNALPGLIAEVERLREAVAAAEAAGEARGLERAAKAVIRLVAEACCEAVTWMPGTISQLPLFQDGFKHGRACAVATIRSTFLPPEARDGEAD